MATKNVLKAATGSLLAVATLMTAMPASAQHRGDRHRDRDGISAGEVIAGAVVIGGLAAILSSNNGNYRDGYYGDRYDGRYNNGYDYRRYGGSRQAIQQCVNAVESRGGRPKRFTFPIICIRIPAGLSWVGRARTFLAMFSPERRLRLKRYCALP